MTPEQWGTLVERFGLPLVMFMLLVIGLLRGWVYFRPHVIALQERLTAMTALYERERVDRMAAEAIVAKFAPANVDLAESVAELSRIVIDSQPQNPTDGRLQGTRRPTRGQ